MQHVAIHAVGLGGGDGGRDALVFQILDHVDPTLESKLFGHAPRGDDLDVGLEGVGGEFEADLVVALAGGAVADGIRTLGDGDVDHALGDERPGDGGAEQVGALVDGVGLHHREDIVLGELLLDIVDIAFGCAVLERLFLQPVEFIPLPEIRTVADDFRIVFFLEPGQQHGGVETTGIG